MRKKRKNTEGGWMPDLMAPILIVICVLPLVVRLKVYSCGYGSYDWYSYNDILTDFYCYYKSRLFNLTGVLALLILAVFFLLYREKVKNMRYYIPLFFYGGLTVCSTIFSINREASWQGNFESFENCLVLLSYVVISLYAYQMMGEEKSFRMAWYGILAVTGVMAMVGLFQVFGHDLLNFPWMQRLVMSAEDYGVYGGEVEDVFTGNNVYLTLYNPNYAGIFLNMMFAVIFVMALTEKSKSRKIIYGISGAAVMVLIWYTYSRASLAALLLTLVLASFAVGSRVGRKKIYVILAGAAGLFLLLAVLDQATGGRYLKRMIDKGDREPLTSLTTSEKSVALTYGGVEYEIFYRNHKLCCTWEGGIAQAGEGEELPLPMGAGSQAFYDKGEEGIYLYLADTTLFFSREENGYLYRNFSGKKFPLQDVEGADFHGLEYLGSARGYIWSRTLPLLKHYLLLGSGPDTFPEVFPQEDVAGKIVYADNPDRVIEKGHNDYLTKWVQTGGLSVVCILVFYIFLAKGGIALCRKKEKDSYRSRVGSGCFLGCISYIAASFANDSTLQTAPVFWVFAGIVFASSKGWNNKEKRK